VSRFVALLVGALFGLGLAISRMVDPDKVLAFLDVGAIAAGAWDPSLALVLAGAVVTNLVGYRLVLRRPHPLLSERFHLPTRRDLDGRLIGGAALFGIGWGLAGYCPGPGLAALSQGSVDAAVFCVALVIGTMATDRWLPASPARAPRTA
jgi:uncharacterized membrane protein YedE/YeeE